MSSSYVREKFRDWARQTAAKPGMPPFFDTVNRHEEPEEQVWWTASFVSEAHKGTFCDRGYIENGYIEVMVFAQPGLGDLPAIQSLESVIPDILNYIDPTHRLVLENAEPIREASLGTAEQRYAVAVLINYAHSM